MSFLSQLCPLAAARASVNRAVVARLRGLRHVALPSDFLLVIEALADLPQPVKYQNTKIPPGLSPRGNRLWQMMMATAPGTRSASRTSDASGTSRFNGLFCHFQNMGNRNRRPNRQHGNNQDIGEHGRPSYFLAAIASTERTAPKVLPL